MAYDVGKFFREIKDTHNVTIVIYSEFGRTTRVNSTAGTDHGNGGGMFVLTSNPELRSYFGSGIYGKMSQYWERSDVFAQ